jgi:hypothetical protein
MRCSAVIWWKYIKVIVKNMISKNIIIEMAINEIRGTT